MWENSDQKKNISLLLFCKSRVLFTLVLTFHWLSVKSYFYAVSCEGQTSYHLYVISMRRVKYKPKEIYRLNYFQVEGIKSWDKCDIQWKRNFPLLSIEGIHFKFKGCWIVIYNSVQICSAFCKQTGELDQMPFCDVLHYLSLSHKKKACYAG